MEYFFEFVVVTFFFLCFSGTGLLFLIYKEGQLELHGVHGKSLKASKVHDFVKEFQRH